MATFQKITMIVALVILIICLIFIGYSLYKSKYDSQFPPVVADCPDYWLDMSEGDGNSCKNVKNLGSCNQTSMNFSSSFWTGNDGLCRKYQWAKQCNLTWDGVTNATDPCDTN